MQRTPAFEETQACVGESLARRNDVEMRNPHARTRTHTHTHARARTHTERVRCEKVIVRAHLLMKYSVH